MIDEEFNCLVFLYKIAQAAIPVCATAIWNQTYGTLAGSMSNAGSTPTLLYSPSDIGFDGYQNMYVVDTDNHRVQRFPLG